MVFRGRPGARSGANLPGQPSREPGESLGSSWRIGSGFRVVGPVGFGLEDHAGRVGGFVGFELEDWKVGSSWRAGWVRVGGRSYAVGRRSSCVDNSLGNSRRVGRASGEPTIPIRGGARPRLDPPYEDHPDSNHTIVRWANCVALVEDRLGSSWRIGWVCLPDRVPWPSSVDDARFPGRTDKGLGSALSADRCPKSFPRKGL